MSSLRLQRVNELLKRQIGEVIRREFPVGEAGLLSVNDVEVSGDLHYATVFVSVLGAPEQQQRAFDLLIRNRKRIQALVAKGVILKYMPQLRFTLDDSITRGNRVLQIIEELENPPRP